MGFSFWWYGCWFMIDHLWVRAFLILVFSFVLQSCGGKSVSERPGESGEQAGDQREVEVEGPEEHGPNEPTDSACVDMGGRCQSPDSVCESGWEWLGLDLCGDVDSNSCCVPGEDELE